MGSGTNREKHDPEVGTRRAQTPPPQPSHPTHERDTAPLPTQITRGDTVSPPHGQAYPPWIPLGRDAPPPREVSQGEAPLRDLLMVNTSPPNTRDSPHPGKKWLQGAALWTEWYPRAPRRKDNSEMLSLIASAAGADTPIGEMGVRDISSRERQRQLLPGKRAQD